MKTLTRLTTALLLGAALVACDKTSEQDLRKAEKYYRMAMDWTEFGYWDVYGNMMKLLEGEKRLEDAAVFAENCAEGIKRQDGTPEETFRKIAQADAERLRKLIENQK